MKNNTKNNINLGVSRCLLGEQVRFDGGHKHNRFITQTLAQHFNLEPFCPELEAGMGMPRPAIHLMKHGKQIRAVATRNADHDYTDVLMQQAKNALSRTEHLSGFIFKKGSPSCGMERVKLYDENNNFVDQTSGLFANAVIKHNPLLPCEEEGRLNDPCLRESFLERVYIYHEWQQIADEIAPADLVRFHSQHKFTLLAHNETIYRQLGRLVASTNKANIKEIAGRYILQLMQGIKKPTTAKRHTNVLMHLLGFLKNWISLEDKHELLHNIDQYRIGHIPLIVPLTLLHYHLKSQPMPYLNQQSYLQNYPAALKLRNAV